MAARRPRRSRVDDGARRGAELLGEVAVGVAVGDEADVVAVGLVRDGEPAPRRPPRAPAPWSSRRAGTARPPAARASAPPARTTGPWPGRPTGAARRRPSRAWWPVHDGVEAERQRPVQHRGELDLLVAPQARVRRAAGGVLGDEVVDHVVGELRRRGPRRRTGCRARRRPGGRRGRPRRAAAARARAQRARAPRQREVHARDVVPGVDRQRRGDRGVDPAAHRGQHALSAHQHRLRAAGQRRAPARRARSTTGPMRLDARASTSAAVEVWPSEKRSEPRARASSSAHGQQHVAGLGDAGGAGRAGGALDAPGVQQHQQAVALAAGEATGGRCRAAGSPDRSAGSPLSTRIGHRGDARRRPGRRAARRARGAPRVLAADGHRDGRREADDAGHVEGAGADVALLAAAVQQRGAGDVAARAAARRRRAGRRACARSASARRRRSRRSRRAAGRPPARRRCGTGCRARARPRPAARTGVDGADLVVGPHDGDQGDVAGVAASAARSVSACTRPVASTSSHVDGRRPRARPATRPRRAPRGAPTALARTRRAARVGGAAGPVEALDGEVVGSRCRREVKHDLATAGRRAPRRSTRATPRRHAAPGVRRSAGTTRCRRARAPRSGRADRLRQHRRGRRVVEVGHRPASVIPSCTIGSPDPFRGRTPWSSGRTGTNVAAGHARPAPEVA